MIATWKTNLFFIIKPTNSKLNSKNTKSFKSSNKMKDYKFLTVTQFWSRKLSWRYNQILSKTFFILLLFWSNDFGPNQKYTIIGGSVDNLLSYCCKIMLSGICSIEPTLPLQPNILI